jgi:prepilin-type N-terminal cleavage/methylation domain-containing protein
MKKQQQTGVTLYELLITLLVIGVVLTIGVPNMVEFRQNSRMTSSANDLLGAFQLARSESARAKTNITICASANAMTANPTCGGNFEQGYIVFVDEDGDIVRDAGEAVLRSHDLAEPGVSFAIANDATFFSYASTGRGRGNVGGNTALSQVVMCDARGNVTAAGGNSASRLFVTTPLGRATILRDQTQIGAALTNMSKTCP